MTADRRDSPIFALDQEDTAGLYVNLDQDGGEEFVLLTFSGGLVYQKRVDAWQRVGCAKPLGGVRVQPGVLAVVSAGDVATQEPAWKELRVGSRRFHVE